MFEWLAYHHRIRQKLTCGASRAKVRQVRRVHLYACDPYVSLESYPISLELMCNYCYLTSNDT